MSTFVRCPVQELELKVIGKEKEYVIDTIYNNGAINLEHIFGVGVEEIKFEKELQKNVIVIFTLFRLLLQPTKEGADEIIEWILPDKSAAIKVRDAFLKGPRAINKIKIKRTAAYGMVEGSDEGTSGADKKA
jgi:hypothetical protein